MVFSATIPQKEVQPFLKKYLSNPVMEKIKANSYLGALLITDLISEMRDKNAQIYELTKLYEPYLAMIFVNTKTRADELHAYLTQLKAW